MSSKRRNLSALVFLLNLITKVNLIRILKLWIENLSNPNIEEHRLKSGLEAVHEILQ